MYKDKSLNMNGYNIIVNRFPVAMNVQEFWKYSPLMNSFSLFLIDVISYLITK